ncbi:MAG TPA: hypothetical protein VJL29_15395 [Thermoguttaceae bacterium]|nr:hypothetical protein [Thermoguttaceae bacterium]
MLLLAVPSTAARADDEQKVVIPFDFLSTFDDGRYGQTIGEMIWKKLDRQGGFIIPESMIEVRETVASRNLRLAPDMTLEAVAKIVRDDFDGQIAIWGSVERVAGHDWDVYDLKIRCVDFSTRPAPTVVYSIDARTKTAGEIPHRYVKELLDRLHGRRPFGPAPVDRLSEEKWKNGPNLVTGGDFQKATGGVPKGWDSRGGQNREPLGRLVRWTVEKGKPSNRVIRLAFEKSLGDTFGVMYYSDFFPVDEGATYRFQCRWRSDGPNAKVFIKCYDAMGSNYQAEHVEAHAQGKSRGKEPGSLERREVYRSQQNLKGPANTWNTHTEDFTPRHTYFTPRWGRVMLFGYLGAGTVEFDDVVVKQIIPASPAVEAKQRRPSQESGVTIDQIRENQRPEAEPSVPTR